MHNGPPPKFYGTRDNLVDDLISLHREAVGRYRRRTRWSGSTYGAARSSSCCCTRSGRLETAGSVGSAGGGSPRRFFSTATDRQSIRVTLKGGSRRWNPMI